MPTWRWRRGLDLPLWSAGDYRDPVRRIISQAKDHGRWDGLPMLGKRLALAVAGVVDAEGLSSHGTLIPIPSNPATVRSRGLDVVAHIARGATSWLRSVGVRVTVCPALRWNGVTADQGGLTWAARQTNVAGKMLVTQAIREPWCLVVDDVVTTGASMREAIRALRAVGVDVRGAATVAATSNAGHRQ